MTTRQWLGLALAATCAVLLVLVYASATDFPRVAPAARVDAALVERCRANPGLHLALAVGAPIEVALDLRDDPTNRWFYGTSVDLREEIPRNAIHIQRKGNRAAIHADAWNPAAGPLYRLIHGTIDVPAVPLIAGLLLGLALAARRGK